MSSFALDVEGEDHLAALMDTSNSTDLHAPASSDTNDAEQEADAALDSILETTVAEVNLALSHDDAVTAAVNAAALDATTSVHTVEVDEVAAAAAVAEEVVATIMKDHHSDHTTLHQVNHHPDAAVEPSSDAPPQLLHTEHNAPTNGDMTTSAAVGTTTTTTVTAVPTYIPSRTGRWSLDEKILFLFGLQKFGKGHWKKISMYVPDRSLVQIKSHAQKVLKRINSGENLFCRLEENVSRLHTLVTQIHAQLNLDPPTVLLQPTTFLSYSGLGDLTSSSTNGGSVVVATTTNKKIKENDENDDTDAADATSRKRPRNDNNSSKPSKEGTEHIAASALCQLAGPEDEENEDGTEHVIEPSNSILTGDVGSIKAEDDIDLGELISI